MRRYSIEKDQLLFCGEYRWARDCPQPEDPACALPDEVFDPSDGEQVLSMVCRMMTWAGSASLVTAHRVERLLREPPPEVRTSKDVYRWLRDQFL